MQISFAGVAGIYDMISALSDLSCSHHVHYQNNTTISLMVTIYVDH